MLGLVSFLLLLAGCTNPGSSETESTATIDVILTGLLNPRGVAVFDDGSVLVAEAGRGDDATDVTERTGRLTLFVDSNDNGYFGDQGEAEPWFEHLASYNAMHVFATGRDEVSGPSDIAVHDDGRVFLSVDGGFDEFGLYEISPSRSIGRNLASRSNMTGVTLSLDGNSLFVAESTFNELVEVSLDDGARRSIVEFATLDSGQQSVPAGIAIDPRNGDILVALFSGVALASDGTYIPFVSGDAKIVRVNPSTGEVTDEITGLTTAVDVTIDSSGNVYVVELATDYAELFERGADLNDPDADPTHGGYLRFSGSVTMHPSGGGPPVVIADGLDSPTNITLADDGALYVSTGQGTPGRPIPGPNGATVIVGEVIRITGF